MARKETTLQAAALLGGLLGPAVGGILADAVGIRAPFTFTGAAAALAALYGFLRLPETRKQAEAAPPVAAAVVRNNAVPAAAMHRSPSTHRPEEVAAAASLAAAPIGAGEADPMEYRRLSDSVVGFPLLPERVVDDINVSCEPIERQNLLSGSHIPLPVKGCSPGTCMVPDQALALTSELQASTSSQLRLEPAAPMATLAALPSVSRKRKAWPAWQQLLASSDFRAIALINAVMFATANGSRSVLMPLLAVQGFGMKTTLLGAYCCECSRQLDGNRICGFPSDGAAQV